MLTIFCSPKPFSGEAQWNQRNALRSWRAIAPEVEIIVFGDVPGAAEVAAEVGAVLVPRIESSPSGAPSFNAMAQHAKASGRHDLQVYANADMLFDRSLVDSLSAAAGRFGRFLLVGERMDLAEGTSLDVHGPALRPAALELLRAGQLKPHGPSGVDYFGYRRAGSDAGRGWAMWEDLAPVFMGRAMCDQALLHYCLRRRIPVIDGTLAVVAVHQFHGYGHVAGGRQRVFGGEDRQEMGRAHGLRHSVPTIADADLAFDAEGGVVASRRRPLLRRVELAVRYRLGLDRVAMAVRAMQYIGGRRAVQAPLLSNSAIEMSWARPAGGAANRQGTAAVQAR